MLPLLLCDNDVATITPPGGGILRWGIRSLSDTWSDAVALKPGMMVRRAFPWGPVQASATSSYNWSSPDTWIPAATAAGIKVMAVLSKAPAWATNGRGAGNLYPEGHQAAFYSFCAAAAVRYPQVAYWEIMNEPDLAGWTSAQVAEILIGAANAMVAARSTAKVIGICTMQAFNRIPSFVNPILTSIRGVSSIYGLSMHCYTRPNAPESAVGGNLVNQMATTVSMMNTAGFSGPLFITEFGDPTTYVEYPFPPGYVSEADAARWLVRQSVIIGSYARVERSSQFQLQGSSTPNDEEGGMGLIRGPNDRGGAGGTSAGPAGSFKPGYYSCQNMMRILNENTLSITAMSTGPLYKYRYDKVGGIYGYIVWTTSGTQPAPLTGMAGNVTVTQNDGSHATVATTGGSITITATVNPQYIQDATVAIKSVSYWESQANLAADLAEFGGYSTSSDSYDYYTLAYSMNGHVAMYRATGLTKYLDRALLYTNNVIAQATTQAGGYLGWRSVEDGNVETSLREVYFWRYVCQMLDAMANAGVTGSYLTQYNTIKAFTETNIFDKWYSRGVNSNLYRSVVHICSHWATISDFIVRRSSGARVAQATTVRDNIDHVGMANWNGDSIRSVIVNHPKNSTANFWKAYFPKVAGGGTAPGIPSTDTNFGSDTSHGSDVLSWIVEAYDRGYGPWNNADINKFISLIANVVWPDASTNYAYLIGSTNSTQDSGNYNTGFLKLGRYNTSLQVRLEGLNVAQNIGRWGNMALNAKILGG